MKLAAAALASTLGLWLTFGRFEYAYIPPAPPGDTSGQLQFGRQTFYSETFGNEVFFTDIMGILDGPLTIPNLVRALVETRGRGTDNLEVRISQDVTVGGRTFRKGTKVKTGLDVPRGAWVPVGLPISYNKGRIKVGITCAVCHAAVDSDQKRVVEGAPNNDLNAGLLLAFATNSAAYFPHARLDSMDDHITGGGPTVPTENGRTARLPDPALLEQSVDTDFLHWPPGSFDASTDLKNNPVQIPDLFTLGKHPYGWTGFAAAGPFHGLTAFNNNFTRDSDPLTQVDSSQAEWGIHKEVYLGTILQRAASRSYRYHPSGGLRPSDFFARIDPTPGTPGVIEVTVPPSYPSVTPVAPAGLYIGPVGRPVWEHANALSVFQNSLVPPNSKKPVSPAAVRGRAVFHKAGCAACHAGSSHTNHRVIPAPLIGTEPSHATTIGTPGGYKVPGLAGLAWTAPYLHDGGVAVGPAPERRPGVAATLKQGVRPDPAESLRALLDRGIRKRVVSANRASSSLRAAHVDGSGHSFWVDQAAGFSPEEQAALIEYLLSWPMNGGAPSP